MFPELGGVIPDQQLRMSPGKVTQVKGFLPFHFSFILAISLFQIISLNPLARIAALMVGTAKKQISGDGWQEVLSQP